MSHRNKDDPEDAFGGAFEHKRLYFYNPSLDEICNFEILVNATPSMIAFARESYKLAEEEQKTFKRALVASLNATVSKADNTDPDESTAFGGKVVVGADPFTKSRNKKTNDHAQELEDETVFLEEQSEQDELNNDGGHGYQIYPPCAPLVLLSGDRIRERKENMVVYKALKEKGAFRPLARIASDRFNAVFDALAENHPLFDEVVRYVRTTMKLCVQRGAPQVIPPMLLAGPPGLGKTHFAKAFAQELGAAFYIIGFDAEHKSAVLLGQDKGWAAATPGVVYEAVVNGDCANPVILLDEIDKARGTGSHYQSPLSSLHSLLEPVSNKTVTDISVGLTFDASLVSWICTCNYLDLVPSTLLSRMKVFHIKHPTDAALAIRMARVMLEKTHELIDLPNFEAPSPKLAPLIAHLSPREQRQELEHAYAIAVASGRRALRIEDFAHLETDDAPAKPKQHLH